MNISNKTKRTNFFRLVATGIFSISLLFGLTGLIENYIDKGISSDITNDYFNNVILKDEYINLYGATQSFFGKLQIENFTIFKNKYGKLVAPREKLSRTEIKDKLSEIIPIINYLEILKIPNIFIEPPLPIVDYTDLPYGTMDYSHQNLQMLHEMLDSFLAFDIIGSVVHIEKPGLFYRTDHHWSGDAVFETYHVVKKWLESGGIIKSDVESSFTRTTVDHFLGSYGVKVGKYYAGEDQYIYYQPSSDAKFTCMTMTADGELIAEHEGFWFDALMDANMLNDPEYHNKYNAALWGNGGENRIINHTISSGKLLIISHSYGRPLAQYLALEFHEVRQIDPQKGRFNGNYLKYIDDYRPDAVLLLVEFEGEIIGEYRTVD